MKSLLKCNEIMPAKIVEKMKRVIEKLSNTVNGKIMYIVPFLIQLQIFAFCASSIKRIWLEMY